MKLVVLGASRVVLTLVALWALLGAVVPPVMERYRAFNIALGANAGCIRGSPCERPLESVYAHPLAVVVGEATLRSLALLAGVALLALSVGVLLGIAGALLRHRPWRAGLLAVGLALVAAIPSFFLAYFLQLAVVFLGGMVGRRLVPVFGFGLDAHLALPLLSLAVPAVAATAHLTAARVGEVLDADFVTAARAKGLPTSWLVRRHVMPHAAPLTLEAAVSGLRVSVASLPIVEYLFVWNGVGYIALQAIAQKDAPALVASALVLAALFSLLGLAFELRQAVFYRLAAAR